MTIKRLSLTALLALAGLLTLAGPAMAQDVEWDYEGDRGPEAWGNLTPAFSTCSTGEEQSPINLTDATRGSDLPRIRARYRATPLLVENNGHTVEAVPEEEQTLLIGGKSYELAQFHFHVPSEHAISGRRYPLEVHFVHQAEDGERAVFGVLVKRGDRNQAFARLGRLPREEGQETEVELPLNPRGLMPRSLEAFRYAGSLTTPPCSEGIRWNVASDYIEMSRRQIRRIRSIIAPSARPLQERNGREIALG